MPPFSHIPDFINQGTSKSYMSGLKFTHDPQGGWSREEEWAGQFQQLRLDLLEMVRASTEQGHPVNADLRMTGVGEDATAIIKFADGHPSGGFADVSQIQWSMDWQRKELNIGASPAFESLTKDQKLALARYAADATKKRPVVVAGPGVFPSDCIWTGEKVPSPNVPALQICDANANPALNYQTPPLMAEAVDVIEKGVTSFVAHVPVLKASGNLRTGAAQRRATINIGRIFLNTELISWEGFPDSFGYALPCAWWVKTAQSVKFVGTSLLSESTYEGINTFEELLYSRAKGPTFGACCLGLECHEVDEAGCTALLGIWLGPSVDCNALLNPCDGCEVELAAAVAQRGNCFYRDLLGVDRCSDGVTAQSCVDVQGQWTAGVLCPGGF